MTFFLFQIYEKASEILDSLKKSNLPVETYNTEISSDLQSPIMADIAEVTLSDKEDNC